MKLLPNGQQQPHENAKKSYVHKKKFEDKHTKNKKYCKGRDYCHCKGESKLLHVN